MELYSGGMCEKKVTVRLNNKIYKTAIRPIVIKLDGARASTGLCVDVSSGVMI